MKTAHRILKGGIASLAAVSALSPSASGQVSVDNVGTGYTQNFNSLVDTGTNQVWTNNTTLPGWYLFNKNFGEITAYDAGSGGSNTGKFYSFGLDAADRALGGVGSSNAGYFGGPAAGEVAGWMAVGFSNNTGGALTGFTLNFRGEQWRNGGNATMAAQPMVLQYGFGATFIDVVDWASPGGSFDWASPVVAPTGAAVDGNVAGLVNNVGGTIEELTWANGTTMWLRWVERNDVGNDHGLAIDDLSITWSNLPPLINYWDTDGPTAGFGGAGTWTGVSTTWNASPDGTGPAQALAAGAKAVFKGNGVTVTIGANAAVPRTLIFETTGYTLSGDTLALNGPKPTIEVKDVAHTATISATLSGSTGMTKAGAGTLVLSGSNTYTGGTTLSDGTVEINGDSALGDAAGALIFGGGELRVTTTVSINANRTVSGSGRVNVAPSQTLTLSGTLNGGVLTLTNSGTLAVAGSVPVLAGLSFTEAGTFLANVGSTTTITQGITTTHTTGTAVVAGGVDFGTGAHTISVARGDAAADLRFTGTVANANISGGTPVTGYLVKTGDGILDLQSDNAGMAGGWQLGIAGSPASPGGTLVVHDALALGQSQLRFNAGTLQNASATPLSFPMSVSIGAGQLDGATFNGSAYEFAGAASIFRGANASYQHRIVANTNVTFGGLTASVGLGSSTGLTITGTGRVIIPSSAIVNDITENVTVDGGRLQISANLAAPLRPAIFLVNGGELGGDQSGSDSLGPVIAQSGGILAPGTLVDATGLLNTESLELQAGSLFNVELSGTAPDAFDRLAVVGTVTLDGGLSVTRLGGFIPGIGATFTIIDNDGSSPAGDLTGTFAGLADNAQFTSGGWVYRIDYDGGDGNDVVLTSVPEPGTIATLLGGLAMLGFARRRRR